MVMNYFILCKHSELEDIINSQEECNSILLKINAELKSLKKNKDSDGGGGFLMTKCVKEIERLYNKFTDFMDQIKNALTRIYNKQNSIITFLEKNEEKLEKMERLYSKILKILDKNDNIEEK